MRELCFYLNSRGDQWLLVSAPGYGAGYSQNNSNFILAFIFEISHDCKFYRSFLYNVSYFLIAIFFFIQLKHGARICQKCDIGYYPIHIAARNGSGKSLDLFIEHGKFHLKDIQTECKGENEKIAELQIERNLKYLSHSQQNYLYFLLPSAALLYWKDCAVEILILYILSISHGSWVKYDPKCFMNNHPNFTRKIMFIQILFAAFYIHLFTHTDYLSIYLSIYLLPFFSYSLMNKLESTFSFCILY